MDDKFRELIQNAIQLTQRGKLRWTAYDSDTFLTSIARGTLRLRIITEEAELIHHVSILEQDREIVCDRAVSVDRWTLANSIPKDLINIQTFLDEQDDEMLVAVLGVLARRSAKQLDENLNFVESALALMK
ncbi:MAG: hypothetical protein ACRCZF_16325 [Gemmataceae bacterium]